MGSKRPRQGFSNPSPHKKGRTALEDRPGPPPRDSVEHAVNSVVAVTGAATAAVKLEITHPVLNRYYASVVPLRQYLLANLPASSKTRQRALLNLGRVPKQSAIRYPDQVADDESYAKWLDHHLVGLRDPPCALELRTRARELESFLQQRLAQSSSASIGNSTIASPTCSQSDVSAFSAFSAFGAFRPTPPCSPSIRPRHQAPTAPWVGSLITMGRVVLHSLYRNFQKSQSWPGYEPAWGIPSYLSPPFTTTSQPSLLPFPTPPFPFPNPCSAHPELAGLTLPRGVRAFFLVGILPRSFPSNEVFAA